MATPIEEITILDANQKFSSEFLGGNNSNALFTNKMGHGIEVEPGDKISIYNSFIAEAGATTDAIEITDKFLGTRELKYTQLTPVNFINGSNEKPLGYERINASNITETVNMNQNNVEILTNYYKTTNGENYFSLPRRFVINDGSGSASVWDSTDNVALGRCYNNGILNTEIGQTLYNGGFEQAFVCDADYFFFIDNASVAPGNPAASEWKLRADNSRYTIFVREDTRYGQQTDMESLSNSLVSNDPGSDVVNGLYSPSEYPYLEYIEKVNINIKQGFVSPSALAETITDQLKDQQEPEINYFSSRLSLPASPSVGYETLLPMSVELNSKTYKTFWSSGTRLSSKALWTEWNSKLATTNPVLFNTSGTNNYLSQYQYIGVKRPDLFKAGREWAANATLNDGGTLTQAYFSFQVELDESSFRNGADINGSNIYGIPNHTLITNLIWDSGEAIKTMDYIKDVINAQENYPELFDNKFNQYKGLTNVNNSR